MTGVRSHPQTRVSLPARYDEYWRTPFLDAVRPHLTEGVRVLDIGSGRLPSLDGALRPPGCEYVGLDISAAELSAAGPDAYDETIAVDVTREVPALNGRFDLAVSWQVLEHVKHLDEATKTVHGYLRPGGTFVSLLSASFAIYAVLNRFIPSAIGHALVGRTMRRDPDKDPVFRAYYDGCHPNGLRKAFRAYGQVTVTPFYRAANYLAFAPALMKPYVAYENWICRRGIARLATHYLVTATR